RPLSHLEGVSIVSATDTAFFFSTQGTRFTYVPIESLFLTVIFNACNGRTRTLFQSADRCFDVDMDGTVTLKRQVTLHEGHKVFSLDAWDSSGKKHTVSVRVERVHHHHEDHHMDTAMNISSPQMESPSDDLVLMFPKSSTGLKRAKRGWVVPPFNIAENSRGPFPEKMHQIKSDYSKELQMHYSITGEGADLDPKGTFTIDRLTGNLFVTRPLDRERKASYRLITYATAVGVDIAEAPFEIIVNVLDLNDNKPVFTQNLFNGNVPEASVIGHEFMTVTATDADDPDTYNGIVSYAIVKQDPEMPKPDLFTINPVTGGIRVNALGLDKEKWSRYTVLITATDLEGRGYSTTGTAVITVTDSNDNAPQFVQTTHTVSVPENKVEAEVARLTVTDGDEEGSPAWSTKYKIISGDNTGVFSVSTGPSQLEGIITTVKPLDFEKNKQFILSVIVENDDPFVGSLATSTATVTVNVEDVNEPPEFNPKERVIFKPEDSPVDSELVTYKAIDPDTAKAQKITYKIGSDPAGWLSVAPDTGVIKVKSLMDRESPLVKYGKYRAIILALDNDGDAPATGTGTLVIELEDVNDNAPVINERNIRMCNRGSAPVLLSISDKDGPPFAGPFRVETHGETSKNWSTSMNGTTTGVFLTPKTALEQGDYKVVLKVIDQGGFDQESTIQASVCDCEGESVQCADCDNTSCPVISSAFCLQ
ncbi:cadherin-1-like, partial [Rhinichthys klamathensis goyatoka]|uniref:cadherin-1-like n=1 Tax=Rhinichthys klamathensis goyatoka TaxID=3034132 RepID=UPI0024B61E07